MFGMLPSLLAIAPATVSWTPKVALVMVVCNVQKKKKKLKELENKNKVKNSRGIGEKDT